MSAVRAGGWLIHFYDDDAVDAWDAIAHIYDPAHGPAPSNLTAEDRRRLRLWCERDEWSNNDLALDAECDRLLRVR